MPSLHTLNKEKQNLKRQLESIREYEAIWGKDEKENANELVKIRSQLRWRKIPYFFIKKLGSPSGMYKTGWMIFAFAAGLGGTLFIFSSPATIFIMMGLAATAVSCFGLAYINSFFTKKRKQYIQSYCALEKAVQQREAIANKPTLLQKLETINIQIAAKKFAGCEECSSAWLQRKMPARANSDPVKTEAMPPIIVSTALQSLKQQKEEEPLYQHLSSVRPMNA